jgi:hypothetical protein
MPPREYVVAITATEYRCERDALALAMIEGERQGARAQYRGTADAIPDAGRILASVGDPFADGRMADAIVAEFRRAWLRGAEAMARFLAGGAL